MSLLKSERGEGSALNKTPPSVQEELTFWEHLVFSFEMENDPSNTSDARPSGNANTHRSRSTSSTSATAQARRRSASRSDGQDAALLAQLVASAGTSTGMGHPYPGLVLPSPYPSISPTPGFYGNFYHHGGVPFAGLQDLSPSDIPWHQLLPSQPGPSNQSSAHQASPSSRAATRPYDDASYPAAQPAASGSHARQSRHQYAASVGSSTESPETTDHADTERIAMAEEKRRRNTAASARFRIKRKQRTTNLERSVNDLTGRAEELEKEVQDLRRENGWLKEIVMLKGSRFAAANLAHHLAQNQASIAASSKEDSDDGNKNPPPDSVVSDTSSEEESEEDKKGKGKGKGKAKQKQKQKKL